MSKYYDLAGNVVERNSKGRPPKGWVKIEEKRQIAPKADVLRAVHVYSGGTEVVAQRGKAKKVLPNGETFVRTIKPEVKTPTPRIKKLKEKLEQVVYKTVTIELPIDKPVSVCIYADGFEKIKGRGRCGHYHNGSPLVRLERRVPGVAHLEAKAEQKSLREDWSLEDADPNAIRGNVPLAWIKSLTPVTGPLAQGTKVWRGNSAHPGNPNFGSEAEYDTFENGKHFVYVWSSYNGKPERLRTSAPNGLFILP